MIKVTMKIVGSKVSHVQMLLRWKRQSGNDATQEILANALIAIGRRDVAETLASMP